jgi:hypothetical protein
MLKKLSLAAVLSVAVGLAAYGAALFDIDFDVSDGTGFVGKGDVQAAFGWNNHDLQENADDVWFSVNLTNTYTYVCFWLTGPAHNRREHRVTRTVEVGVSGDIVHTVRRNPQDGATGFVLNGYSEDLEVETGGALPHVGDPCPGNPGTGAVVESAGYAGGAGGGLYVHFEDQSVLIWSPE